MRAFFGHLLGLVMVVGLAGCSSVAVVTTYESGTVAQEQRAILHAPGDINVLSVNGKEMKNYLIDDLPIDYALAPGSNEIIFIYKSIWAKPTTGENGSKVDVVETAKQRAVFEARPSGQYHFDLLRPEDKASAQRFARKPTIRIVDGTGGTVARSENYVVPVATASGVATAGSAGTGAGGTGAASLSNGLPTIDAMKVLWEQATTEEKREFLRWAFK